MKPLRKEKDDSHLSYTELHEQSVFYLKMSMSSLSFYYQDRFLVKRSTVCDWAAPREKHSSLSSDTYFQVAACWEFKHPSLRSQSQKRTNGTPNGFYGDIDWDRYVSKCWTTGLWFIRLRPSCLKASLLFAFSEFMVNIKSVRCKHVDQVQPVLKLFPFYLCISELT